MWATIPTSNSSDLLRTFETRLAGRISSGAFTEQDIWNIQNRKMSLIPDDLVLSPERLEKLRRLCQTWEVDLRAGQITSHRKFVGPVIVRMKKILFPLVRFVMKDFIREQRDFNAATISIISDLCNESARRSKE